MLDGFQDPRGHGICSQAGEVVHLNPGASQVGSRIEAVTGKRCTFSFFPWRWTRGDGCIIRLVAMLDPSGSYRIETGR